MVGLSLNTFTVALAQVLNCKVSQLPIKYLGVPLSANYKDSALWDTVTNIFLKKLAI